MEAVPVAFISAYFFFAAASFRSDSKAAAFAASLASSAYASSGVFSTGLVTTGLVTAGGLVGLIFGTVPSAFLDDPHSGEPM